MSGAWSLSSKLRGRVSVCVTVERRVSCVRIKRGEMITEFAVEFCKCWRCARRAEVFETARGGSHGDGFVRGEEWLKVVGSPCRREGGREGGGRLWSNKECSVPHHNVRIRPDI